MTCGGSGVTVATTTTPAVEPLFLCVLLVYVRSTYLTPVRVADDGFEVAIKKRATCINRAAQRSEIKFAL